jgi:hypothetical protein
VTVRAEIYGQPRPAGPRPLEVVEPERDVMTADEVAAFLGVDRNTVYDYANRYGQSGDPKTKKAAQRCLLGGGDKLLLLDPIQQRLCRLAHHYFPQPA